MIDLDGFLRRYCELWQADRDRFKRELLAARLDEARFQHHFVATLVDTGGELILFDTGCGELKRGIGVGDFSGGFEDNFALVNSRGVEAAWNTTAARFQIPLCRCGE